MGTRRAVVHFHARGRADRSSVRLRRAVQRSATEECDFQVPTLTTAPAAVRGSAGGPVRRLPRPQRGGVGHHAARRAQPVVPGACAAHVGPYERPNALGGVRLARHVQPLPPDAHARPAWPSRPQERTPERGQPELLLELTGQDLIGTPVKRCGPFRPAPQRRSSRGGLLHARQPPPSGVPTAQPPERPPAWPSLPAPPSSGLQPALPARPRVRAAAADHPHQQGHGRGYLGALRLARRLHRPHGATRWLLAEMRWLQSTCHTPCSYCLSCKGQSSAAGPEGASGAP